MSLHTSTPTTSPSNSRTLTAARPRLVAMAAAAAAFVMVGLSRVPMASAWMPSSCATTVRAHSYDLLSSRSAATTKLPTTTTDSAVVVFSSSNSDEPVPSTTTTTTSTSTTNTNANTNTKEDNETSLTLLPGRTPSDQWELDCYSRPVVLPGNKKLWEVLLTDQTGSFRYVHTLASNQVNSKVVRGVVESFIEQVQNDADATTMVPPTTIRFFRGAMFNMINIALSDVDAVVAKPSRCTFALAQWLQERHQQVYPNMEGYRANMVAAGGGALGGAASFLNVRTPIKLPDALRGEQYAFVSLPLAEFLPGGDITADNVGVGRLCPLDDLSDGAAGDTFVQGVVILSQRANALATWLAGTEVVGLVADLRKRQLILEADIDTQYLMARLDEVQRTEGAALEQGKDALQGLHFISVQQDDDSDPAGFWLLREIPTGI